MGGVVLLPASDRIDERLVYGDGVLHGQEVGVDPFIDFTECAKFSSDAVLVRQSLLVLLHVPLLRM